MDDSARVAEGETLVPFDLGKDGQAVEVGTDLPGFALGVLANVAPDDSHAFPTTFAASNVSTPTADKGMGASDGETLLPNRRAASVTSSPPLPHPPETSEYLASSPPLQHTKAPTPLVLAASDGTALPDQAEPQLSKSVQRAAPTRQKEVTANLPRLIGELSAVNTTRSKSIDGAHPPAPETGVHSPVAAILQGPHSTIAPMPRSADGSAMSPSKAHSETVTATDLASQKAAPTMQPDTIEFDARKSPAWSPEMRIKAEVGPNQRNSLGGVPKKPDSSPTVTNDGSRPTLASPQIPAAQPQAPTPGHSYDLAAASKRLVTSVSPQEAAPKSAASTSQTYPVQVTITPPVLTNAKPPFVSMPIQNSDTLHTVNDPLVMPDTGSLDPSASDPLRTALDREVRQSPIARSIATQVAEAIRTPPDGTVEIRLSPEELGRVKLSIQPGDSGTALHLVAERSETLDLLRRHADILDHVMSEAGFAHLDFSFRQEGDPHNSAPRADNVVCATDAPHTDAPTLPYPLHLIDPSRPLDIRL